MPQNCNHALGFGWKLDFEEIGWHQYVVFLKFTHEFIREMPCLLCLSYFPFGIANGSARRASFKYQITGFTNVLFYDTNIRGGSPNPAWCRPSDICLHLASSGRKWKKFLNKSSIRFLQIKKVPKPCYRQQKLCITDACLNFGYFNWILNFPTFVSVQLLILSAATKMQTSIVFPT